MKRYRRAGNVLIFLAIGFGLTWAAAKYIATPPPTGEVYRSVPDWPRLPDNIDIGQVGGTGVDSHAIALGSDDTLYVGKVATGMRIQKFMK